MVAGLSLAALLSLAAPDYLGGDERWAAFRWDDGRCEARGRAWRVLPDSQRHRQPMVSFVFAKGGVSYVHVHLRRRVAEGTRVALTIDERPFILEGADYSAFSTPAQARRIIGALRDATRMRVTARSLGGQRFSDFYPMGGIPAAIDAAAAGCAG